MEVAKFTLWSTKIPEDTYEFRLGVSEDTLVVLNNKNEPVRRIIWGEDLVLRILVCDDLDLFLDTINLFTNLIKTGKSPEQWLLDNI
jgi:hypothetical protein